ncbi:MAG: NAD-dependent epimerase/dehydratase family protein [Alphaproteobacteria bacterium]
MTNVVTGGAGFFGEVLVQHLLNAGEKVTCFDLNAPSFTHKNLTIVQGDVRVRDDVKKALKKAARVYHNIAQVPVAKDKALFKSVNETGTRILLEECVKARVEKFIYTSSSAVFGVPAHNPVRTTDTPTPGEAYGLSKLVGEQMCMEFAEQGLPYSIVRPRTVLGHGRLGIFQILFEWVYQGKNIPVLGNGDNLYQFVHGDDLARACHLAGHTTTNAIYHVGAAEFGTMRQVLEHLCAHAGTGSTVKSVPMGVAEMGMNITSSLGLSPLGAYHALMYGRSMYFDMAETKKSLKFTPTYSNNLMFTETYDWYVQNRDAILSSKLAGSKHQSAMKQHILALVPYLI